MTTKTENVFVRFIADLDEEHIGTRLHLSVINNGEPMNQHGMLDVSGETGELTIFTTPVKRVVVSSEDEAEKEMLKAFRHTQ